MTRPFSLWPPHRAALVFSTLVFGAAAHADTFDTVCAECHTGGFKGFVSGAPNVRKPQSWKPYLDKHSAAQMKQIVLYGTQAHKAKGGCTACSDSEIVAIIDAIRARLGQP